MPILFNKLISKAFPSNAATFFAVEWTYRLWLRRPIVLNDNPPICMHNESQIITGASELLLMPTEAKFMLFEPILVI